MVTFYAVSRFGKAGPAASYGYAEVVEVPVDWREATSYSSQTECWTPFATMAEAEAMVARLNAEHDQVRAVLDGDDYDDQEKEGGERANLRWANLAGANLVGADLVGANLAGANLVGADLSGADLRWANLWANLAEANLAEANLAGANLVGANLVGANLVGANLRWADLAGANLVGANLVGANLRWADLAGANLVGANLVGANLAEANLAEANLAEANLFNTHILDGYSPCTGVYRAYRNLGSRNDTLHCFWNGKWLIRAGCFGGTLEQFDEAVLNTHGDGEHGRACSEVIHELQLLTPVG